MHENCQGILYQVSIQECPSASLKQKEVSDAIHRWDGDMEIWNAADSKCVVMMVGLGTLSCFFPKGYQVEVSDIPETTRLDCSWWDAMRLLLASTVSWQSWIFSNPKIHNVMKRLWRLEERFLFPPSSQSRGFQDYILKASGPCLLGIGILPLPRVSSGIVPPPHLLIRCLDKAVSLTIIEWWSKEDGTVMGVHFRKS